MPDIYRAVWMILGDTHWLQITKLARQYRICSYYIFMIEKKLVGASSWIDV